MTCNEWGVRDHWSSALDVAHEEGRSEGAAAERAVWVAREAALRVELTNSLDASRHLLIDMLERAIVEWGRVSLVVFVEQQQAKAGRDEK